MWSFRWAQNCRTEWFLGGDVLRHCSPHGFASWVFRRIGVFVYHHGQNHVAIVWHHPPQLSIAQNVFFPTFFWPFIHGAPINGGIAWFPAWIVGRNSPLHLRPPVATWRSHCWRTWRSRGGRRAEGQSSHARAMWCGEKSHGYRWGRATVALLVWNMLVAVECMAMKETWSTSGLTVFGQLLNGKQWSNEPWDFKGFPVTFFRQTHGGFCRWLCLTGVFVRGVLPVWPARCDAGGREICLGPNGYPSANVWGLDMLEQTLKKVGLCGSLNSASILEVAGSYPSNRM